ncbi:MAG: protein-L-isoaspartate(D-aspartate) O-methyltransferase [Bacteroidales bacterium]
MDSYRHRGLRNKLAEGLKNKGISDEKVLQAIRNVPRHELMDSSFLEYAYQDKAFPIGSGQTISQPFTVAFQSQLLEIEENMKVLEIGTGSGYQALILLEMGAKVFTIERQLKLYKRTKQFLERKSHKIQIFHRDGYLGLPAFAPFDRIIITAATPQIPVSLKQQLKIGGKLVAPVGGSNIQTMTRLTRISKEEFEEERYGGFVFVPLLPGKAED